MPDTEKIIFLSGKARGVLLGKMKGALRLCVFRTTGSGQAQQCDSPGRGVSGDDVAGR